MKSDAASLAARLAENAEAVCKQYLSQGRRCGRYWLVGDVFNTPGRSLFVRLAGPTHGPGAAGKWTDAATGEHGDLLDLIALNRGHACFRDTLDEVAHLSQRALARRAARAGTRPRATARSRGPPAVRRLTRGSRHPRGNLPALPPHHGAAPVSGAALPSRLLLPRPRDAPLETWPALIAAVTDLSGNVTGVHRTWLALDGSAKAESGGAPTPRHGRSPRPRRAVRRRPGCAGGGGGHRDNALLEIAVAAVAHVRGPFRRAPCRPAASAVAEPPLRRRGQ